METYTLFNGRLTLHRQKNNPSEDALWLACAVQAQPHDTVLDAGCGNGIVGLALSTRTPQVHLTGLDTNQEALTQAAENATLNHLPFTSIQGSIFNHSFPPASFDHTFSNPPFHLVEEGFKTQDTLKNHAHGIHKNALFNWVATLREVTKPEGTTTLIVHAKSVPDLVGSAAARVVYLQTKEGAVPKRAIIQFGREKAERTLEAWHDQNRQACLGEGKSVWDL